MNYSLGYAFHVGSILPKKEGELLFDKIDSVISQVDEIDSKYYQFEGGLTLTCMYFEFAIWIFYDFCTSLKLIELLFSALIVEGIYKLSEAINKPPPLTNAQLVKFLNYFLSRVTVSRPRGAFGLLQVLSKLAENNVSLRFRIIPV